MTEEEWLEGLRGLPDDVILKIHFDLQEKIKKHYKLRDSGKNLEKAIHYCQQQIALAPLAMSAMKKNPGMHDNGQFFAPWTSWLQAIRDDPQEAEGHSRPGCSP